MEDVPGGDVLLGSAHAFQEPWLRSAWLRSARPRRQLRLGGWFAPVRWLPARGEFFLDARDVLHGALVGNFGRFSPHVRRRHNMDLVPQMIEGEHAIEKHQHTVGNVQVIRSVLSYVLQPPHDVIRAITDGAGGERRQAFHCRWTMLLQQFLYDCENISRAPFDFLNAVTFDRDLMLARAEGR